MVGLVALAPGAQAGGPKISTILKGTWVGTYEGYAGAEKEHITGQQKFVITKTRDARPSERGNQNPWQIQNGAAQNRLR